MCATIGFQHTKLYASKLQLLLIERLGQRLGLVSSTSRSRTSRDVFLERLGLVSSRDVDVSVSSRSRGLNVSRPTVSRDVLYVSRDGQFNMFL